MQGWLTGKRARLVSPPPAVRAAIVDRCATVEDDVAACDILVHAAPAPPYVAAHELQHAAWRATLDLGLDQRFLLAKAFAAGCRARGSGGAIVFIGAPEQALGADHAAAGGALGNLVKTLGVEWARDGIRVNCIQTLDASATLGRLAAYLVSDYGAYITGAVLGVSQGEGS